MKLFLILFVVLIFCQNNFSLGQNLPANYPILEEYLRREQLINADSFRSSFNLRPIHLFENNIDFEFLELPTKSIHTVLLPVLSTTQFNTNRPYGWGNFGMIPNVGLQQYLTGGIYSKWKFLSIQLQPEIVIAENSPYFGFQSDFPDAVTRARFVYWNQGDYPERFGESIYSRVWWGQSKVSANFGSFEFGASTQNIWWGPGQWNALTFSNNSEGFFHLTLNTAKPAETFIGNFEGQLISGRIDESGIAPSQDAVINERFFSEFSGDWKYINAITLSYNPKWVPGVFLGFNRTFQVYRENMGNSFLDYFPVFSGVTKEQFFDDGNSVTFDSDGADQQISVFFRWIIPKSKFEFYGEYGRRDHALNWREFILNPEHARAYLIGFKKLFVLPKQGRFFQIRGEITHQQESINRYIRYPGLGGGLTWHTHNPSRGFAKNGQALGVGIGVGSNVQTLEMAIVQNFTKFGLIVERLENHQDFYYKAQLQFTEHKPWIDLSFGLLFDHRWNNLLVNSKVQFINSQNYQWQLESFSTQEFPKGRNIISLNSQLTLVYLFNQNNSK